MSELSAIKPTDRIPSFDGPYTPPIAFHRDSITPISVAPINKTFRTVAETVGLLDDLRSHHRKIANQSIENTNESLIHQLQKHAVEQKELNTLAESSTWWDYVRKIGTTVLSGVPLAAGASILLNSEATLATVVGGLSFIGSGICSFLGSTYLDTKVHPTAAAAFQFIGGGLAIVGTGINFFTQTLNIQDALSKVLVSSFAIVGNGIQASRGIYDRKLSQIREADTATSKLIELDRYRQNDLVNGLKRADQELTQATESCIAHSQQLLRAMESSHV